MFSVGWLELVYNRVYLFEDDDAHIMPPLVEKPVDTSAMLPLFYEEAHSVAMILHSLNILQRTTHFLNDNQTPVVTYDQPLYAIAKSIQWHFPSTHGEDKFVIMLGGLHTKMAALKVIGSWLEGSGWNVAITQANIASAGTADSFIKASHVTRIRHAHQVTALHILMKSAYNDYKNSQTEQSKEFEEWKVAMCK